MTIETAMTIVAVIREDTNDATTTDWIQLGSFTACACIFFINFSTVIHSTQCHVNLQDVAGFRVVVLLVCMNRATTEEFPSTAQVQWRRKRVGRVGHGHPTFWQIEATPTNLLHASMLIALIAYPAS